MEDAEDNLDTRSRIRLAALDVFADLGFEGASTREIARRADVNQGLITYYFKSKDALWREAASTVFAEIGNTIAEQVASADADSPQAFKRHIIRAMVRFHSQRPQFVRFMVAEGNRSSERMKWLVDNHLKPIYASLPFIEGPPARKAHEFFALIGASAMIFALRAVCERIADLEPTDENEVQAHADFIADLFVP